MILRSRSPPKAGRTGGRGGREVGGSTGSSASRTEGHTREVFFELFLLLRVGGARQPIGQIEEPLLLPFLGFQAASTKSTTTRFALVFCVLAKAFTRRATRGGRLTLWRMVSPNSAYNLDSAT